MKHWSSLSILLLAPACASAPAAPFDTFPNSNVVAYRLQNYEPPAPVAGTDPSQAPVLPGIPPQIQQWAQQALPGLQQMIPPGLLPPGLIPGMPSAVPQPAPQAPRFHGFRILEQQAVINQDLKEHLAELLGDKDSFQPAQSNCMYAEMGISFSSTPAAAPNDVLISFSCNQMQAHNFIWPHQNSGMTPDTVKDLADVVAKLFPPSMGAPAPVAQL
ncbi:MAG TPA: hypothetical protein VHM70_07190 [Polyangiaceae bacterium]|jgi:hypothetical protein|nr:hypothetical protein [Polyangiaceae bacterium]